MMRMLDVCSGIGGISLGAHLTGAIETVAFSEVEPFPSAVLAHHWPHIPNLGDIHGITKTRLASAGLLPIDILAGGFPCQPFSHAGKRKGQADTRNLWPEMARLVGDLEPEWFVGENVFGLLSIGVERGKHHGYFGDIQRDLARLGYASGWCVLSAADAGAPHLRKRVFILANRSAERVECAMRFLANAQQRGWHPRQQWNAGWKTGATADVCGRQRGAMAHAGGGQWDGREKLSARRDEVSREQQLRDDAGGCDGSGVGLADPNEPGLQERDGSAGTRGACTAADECGARQTQQRVGTPTDELSTWVVGRFPAGPGQAQEIWEAPRTVTGRVPGRAAKLKAVGNSVMPIQIYPVFAAIVATEQVMTQGESAA